MTMVFTSRISLAMITRWSSPDRLTMEPKVKNTASVRIRSIITLQLGLAQASTTWTRSLRFVALSQLHARVLPYGFALTRPPELWKMTEDTSSLRLMTHKDI